MKKIIMTLALIGTVVAFAGPKEDYQKAEALLKQNKVQEAVQLLKSTKPAKGEEEQYAEINIFLARNASDNKQALAYYQKAANSGNNEASRYALYFLSSRLEPKDALQYLLKLNTYVPNNPEILAKLAIINSELNNKSKYNMYVSQGEALKDSKDRGYFYLLIGEYLLSKGNEQGINMLNSAIKLNIPKMSSEAYRALSLYYYNVKKDKSMGDKMLVSSYAVDPKDPTQYINAAVIAYNTQGAAKAYDIYKKGYDLVYKDKKIDVSILDYGFILALASNNKREARVYESKLRSLYKATDLQLANELQSAQLIDQSISYYKAALKSKVDTDRKIAASRLIEIYAMKKDYNTAKSYISSKYFTSDEIKNLNQSLSQIMKK